MTIKEISEMPDTHDGGGRKIHASIFRSYQVLEKAKYFLREGVPAKIVLELVDEMEGNKD